MIDNIKSYCVTGFFFACALAGVFFLFASFGVDSVLGEEERQVSALSSDPLHLGSIKEQGVDIEGQIALLQSDLEHYRGCKAKYAEFEDDGPYVKVCNLIRKIEQALQMVGVSTDSAAKEDGLSQHPNRDFDRTWWAYLLDEIETIKKEMKT